MTDPTIIGATEADTLLAEIKDLDYQIGLKQYDVDHAGDDADPDDLAGLRQDLFKLEQLRNHKAARYQTVTGAAAPPAPAPITERPADPPDALGNILAAAQGISAAPRDFGQEPGGGADRDWHEEHGDWMPIASSVPDDAAPAPTDELGPPTPSVQVLTPDGHPIPAINRDQPFVVSVHVPSSSAKPPETIDVSIATKNGSATLTLRSIGGNHTDGYTYQSQPMTLEHGGEGGGAITIATGTRLQFEFSTGGTGAIATDNGEPIQISYGESATTVQAFDSALDQTIWATQTFIAGFDTFVRQTLINLKNQPVNDATRALKAWAENKLRILENWHTIAGSPTFGRMEQAHYGIAYWTILRTVDDTRDRRYEDIISKAREDITNGYRDAFTKFQVDFTLGFYQAYISSLPLVSQLWTLKFGEDIMGRKIDGWEYVMTVLDTAGQVAMLAMPYAMNRHFDVGHTTARIEHKPKQPTVPPKAPTPITSAVAGTRINIEDLKKFGITPEQAKAFNREAAYAVQRELDRARRLGVEPRFTEVHIEIRAMDEGVLVRLREGSVGKPEGVKPKSINSTDIDGGWAKAGTKNLVGIFDETRVGKAVNFDFSTVPTETLEQWEVRPPPPPAGVTKPVWKRAIQRAKEFRVEGPVIREFEAQGLLKVDADGLIRNYGIADYKLDPHTHKLVPIKGRGFKKSPGKGETLTGDPDAWAVRNQHGEDVPYEVRQAILKRLYKDGVRHDAVTNWDIENDPHYTPAEKAKNLINRDRILASGKGQVTPEGEFGPAEGASAQATFRGYGKTRVTSYGGAPLPLESKPPALGRVPTEVSTPSSRWSIANATSWLLGRSSQDGAGGGASGPRLRIGSRSIPVAVAAAAGAGIVAVAGIGVAVTSGGSDNAKQSANSTPLQPPVETQPTSGGAAPQPKESSASTGTGTGTGGTSTGALPTVCSVLPASVVGAIAGQPMVAHRDPTQVGCIYLSTNKPRINTQTAYPPFIQEFSVTYNAQQPGMPAGFVDQLFAETAKQPGHHLVTIDGVKALIAPMSGDATVLVRGDMIIVGTTSIMRPESVPDVQHRSIEVAIQLRSRLPN